MSESSNRSAPESSERMTAGAMLRQARQARGLHIGALATSIKVPPKTLEMLEADRYDELLDLTFARALAQTVCRSLKIDPLPVLALLPKASGESLGRRGAGINQTFSHRSGRAGLPLHVESKSWLRVLRPQWLLPGLLVLSAAVVYFFPGDWRLGSLRPSSLASETSLPPAVVTDSTSVLNSQITQAPVEFLPPADTASAAVTVLAPTEPQLAPVAVPPLLELRVIQNAWIEVQDAGNKPLIARLVQAGEVVNLEGVVPLRLKVGNASNTTVRFRGQAVDLTTSTRDNVARIELK